MGYITSIEVFNIIQNFPSTMVYFKKYLGLVINQFDTYIQHSMTFKTCNIYYIGLELIIYSTKKLAGVYNIVQLTIMKHKSYFHIIMKFARFS